MLDKKIIGFKQTVREFFKSKTNQTAIIAIASAGVAMYTGAMPFHIGVQTILGSVFAVTIKDATVK